MGLFDSLVKGVTGTIKNAAVDAVRNSVLNNQGQSGGFSNQSGAAANTPYQSAPQQVEAGGHTVGYFKELLHANFSPAYVIRENVSPSELGGSGRPYDFVLLKEGRIVGVIPLAEHNRTNNAAWKNARESAENAGIPFINFHLHMPNTKAFVIDRINRLLG
ncbi:MAG: hypothetical protein LBS74_07800 [Oscillospiraceae bacterium]|jgi:hypothetical protein|nr:hypothetical protein [Oscillospiraceae bacterium]